MNKTRSQPCEDDFGGEDSDSNIAKLEMKHTCAKGRVLSFTSGSGGDSLKKEPVGLNPDRGQGVSRKPEVGKWPWAWGTA